ncbi:MAG: tRNA pseudouridine(55) synthase TruB [Thermanaerothrix sp.]|nr:tRNA pseudouridine(55) synthase TruB [Thermanaerothrix sp.]
MCFSGFLLIDKEEGLRSTACVEQIRSRLGRSLKVGHAGTLDSGASGLLVLLIGRSTRLAELVMSFPKEYMVDGMLGVSTDTDDMTGKILHREDPPRVSSEQVDRAVASMLGCRFQRPPVISAVHVGGRRAHEISRSGEMPDIAPREVMIRSIDILRYPDREGVFSLGVLCGKGTYVRSVVRDLGTALGTVASVLRLRRMSVGPFAVKDAVPFSVALELPREDLLSRVVPASRVLSLLPCGDVPERLDKQCVNGASIHAKDLVGFRISPGLMAGGAVFVRHSAGGGIYRLADGGRLDCVVNMVL